MQELVYLESSLYPVVQLNFSDKSSVVYAIEQSQFMQFISEVYIAVPAGERQKAISSSKLNSLSVLLIQNHGIQRPLRIKGRDLIPNFAQDYFTSLVEDYYRVGESDERNQSIVARLLANFTLGLPNVNLQLKLFFHLCTRVINIYLYLKEKHISEYFQKKTTKRNQMSVVFFKPATSPAHSKKQMQSEENSPVQIKNEPTDAKQAERLVECLYFLEDNMKLLNLMLGDKAMITELSANLFRQSESKIKTTAVRRLSEILYDLMDLGMYMIDRRQRDHQLSQHTVA